MTAGTAAGSEDTQNRERKRAIAIAGEEFFLGDTIVVQGDGAKLPFIGTIKGCKKKSKGSENLLVHVNWFYRPEETKPGRKQFHGVKELFRSNHFDWIEPETISGKCRVHTLSTYRDLEMEEEEDYYQRFTYMPTLNKFGPESVPVYCICALPYNPDTYMIMCEECEEWYHPRCIGLSGQEVQHYDSTPFSCPACVKTGQPVTDT